MRGRGLEITIDALALLPGVRLRLVGPGPAAYFEGLRARAAAAAGVADRVEFAARSRRTAWSRPRGARTSA